MACCNHRVRRLLLGAVAVLVTTGALLTTARTPAPVPMAADQVVWWDQLRQERLIGLLAAIRALQAPPDDPLAPRFDTPDPVPSDPRALGFVWPVRSLVDLTSAFGWRIDPVGGRHQFHHGIDVRCAQGELVRAVTDGTVASSGAGDRVYGSTVTLEHDYRVRSFYAHLSSVGVSEGDHVRAGRVVGRCGATGRATGPHLHLEILFGEVALDPLAFLVPTPSED